MSFSQKYSGKVLVPWYNHDEWSYVCNNLRVRNTENYRNILNILKMWKTRIPLLSAGVEGTLIILDALLIKETNLSTHYIQPVYAISTMRFLNLCAANNERQGTFSRTVQSNNLPKWLINIRHDIAHDHKLPSKALLKLALTQSLEWLIEKYWNLQNKTMFDYMVKEYSQGEHNITIYLNLYIKFVKGSYLQDNIVEIIKAIKNLKCIKEVLRGRIKEKSKTDKCDLLSILEDMIKQSLQQVDKNAANTIAELLVTETALLSTPENLTEGKAILPVTFTGIWVNLLTQLFHNHLLHNVVEKLIEVTNDGTFSERTRLIASLWIYEIFLNVGKWQQTEINLPDNIETSLKKFMEETEKLEEKALRSPNNYTLNYLEGMLKFNKNSEDFISDMKRLVENYISVKSEICLSEQLFTSKDLGDILCDNDVNQDMDTDDNCEPTKDTNNLDSTNRWTVIKNKAGFAKCPLGVLPQQNRERNPLIHFEKSTLYYSHSLLSNNDKIDFWKSEPHKRRK